MGIDVKLKEGERVIGLYRQYWLAWVRKIVFGFILLALPFFFMAPLFSRGFIGIIIFAVILAAALYYILKNFLLYFNNKTTITSQRVIDIEQKSLFDRRVSQAYYHEIVDVAHRIRGFFPTIFHYGTVMITSAAGKVRFEILRQKNPEELAETINELRELRYEVRRQE